MRLNGEYAKEGKGSQMNIYKRFYSYQNLKITYDIYIKIIEFLSRNLYTKGKIK